MWRTTKRDNSTATPASKPAWFTNKVDKIDGYPTWTEMEKCLLNYKITEVEQDSNGLAIRFENLDLFQDGTFWPNGDEIPIPKATSTLCGIMSATDKAKLDSIADVAITGSYNDLKDKPTINTGVTSVGLTMPTTYFTVANSPITTSGTLSVSLKTGYTIPTTALLNSFVKCVTETVSITEDTLYDAGTITDQKHVFFVNSTTDTDFVVTIDNSSSFKTPDGHVLQLTVPANGYAECNFINVNGTIFVRGI